MEIIALIGALALASIPISLGWRRSASEAQMARAMGLTQEKRRFDPEKWAKQTGTGLTFRQILFGGITWLAGGFLGGLALGGMIAILFAISAGLLYAGTFSDKRQAIRMKQAKDILRGLGIVETLLVQGKPLSDALDEAAHSVGPDGHLVLTDLTERLRAASADEAPKAVREWTQAWDNPAVDIVATSLLAALEGRIEIGPLIANLRLTLSSIVEVLSRARAIASGIEWQAKFLAIYPPGVLVAIAITTPDSGQMYAQNPFLILPVVIGSSLSYILSSMMIRNGLSIEASMGLQAGQYEIRVDRMGRVL